MRAPIRFRSGRTTSTTSRRYCSAEHRGERRMSDRLRIQRLAAFALLVTFAAGAARAQPSAAEPALLTEAVCTGAALAATVPADRIGEPVSAVVLDSLTWVAAAQNMTAHCLVN